MPRITQVALYRVRLHSKGGGQKLSGGRVISQSTAIIVAVTSDSGLTGWGEAAPWGLHYLPTFPGAIEAAMAHLAPALIGCDPRALGCVQDRLTSALLEQPFAVSALDTACWDLAGQALGVPCHTLLGGRRGDAPFITAHIGTIEDDFTTRMQAYRADGVQQFCAKMSGDVATDVRYIQALHAGLKAGESIKVDTNRGWRLDEALRVSQQVPPGMDISFEQPCHSYEACRDFQRATGRVLILDEGATDLSVLMRAWSDGVLGGLNMKIARLGGLGGARVVRDALAALDVPLHIQDMGGSDIAGAAIGHLAASMPGRVMMAVWDPGNLVATRTATGGAEITGARMTVSDEPGLGLTPIPEVLGPPVALCDAQGFRTIG